MDFKSQAVKRKRAEIRVSALNANGISLIIRDGDVFCRVLSSEAAAAGQAFACRTSEKKQMLFQSPRESIYCQPLMLATPFQLSFGAKGREETSVRFTHQSPPPSFQALGRRQACTQTHAHDDYTTTKTRERQQHTFLPSLRLVDSFPSFAV